MTSVDQEAGEREGDLQAEGKNRRDGGSRDRI